MGRIISSSKVGWSVKALNVFISQASTQKKSLVAATRIKKKQTYGEHEAFSLDTAHLPGLLCYCVNLGAGLMHVSENSVNTYRRVAAGQLAREAAVNHVEMITIPTSCDIIFITLILRRRRTATADFS